MKKAVTFGVLALALVAGCGSSRPATPAIYSPDASLTSLQKAGWTGAAATGMPDTLTKARQVGYLALTAPDGRQLATFELSEATQVVDLRSHRTSYLPGFRELGFGRFVGNTRLFRTTTSGYFDLLDIASASRVGAPFPFQSNPQDAILIGFALSPDGKYVFVGGPGASVRRITLDPARWATVACDVAGRNLSRAEWDRYFGSIAAYDRTCPNSPPGR